MPMLPAKFDPFQRRNVYQELGLDPYAPIEEISDRLEALSKELEALPDSDDKQARVTNFQEAVRIVKTPRQRVLANALIPDPLNRKHLAELLRRVTEHARAGEKGLPPLDLAQVLLEGADEEMAQADFHDVDTIDALEINLDEVNQLLRAQPEPRHLAFES